MPSGLLSWIPVLFRTDPKEILHKNGLDAYCFVRYLYLMIEIFLPW